MPYEESIKAHLPGQLTFDSKGGLRCSVLRIATLTAAIVFFVHSGTSLAQLSTGRITGTVRDANFVPVAGAPVTITNQETGATTVVRTNETGAFSAVDLAPGMYTVTADPQGFLPVVHQNQRIDAGAKA